MPAFGHIVVGDHDASFFGGSRAADTLIQVTPSSVITPISWLKTGRPSRSAMTPANDFAFRVSNGEAAWEGIEERAVASRFRLQRGHLLLQFEDPCPAAE